MEDKPKIEWVGSVDMAEVAEALGVNTVDVMAVLENGAVMFTPNPNDADPIIYLAPLGRDADGILRAGPREKLSSTSEFHDQVKALMERAMRDLDA